METLCLELADLVSALPEELALKMRELGQAEFRGRQIFSWLHRHGVTDAEAMSNLPQELRFRLSGLKSSYPGQLGRVLCSEDGTRKLEIRLATGDSVETVLIPDGAKLTQCISSQIGCAVRCAFCRSGASGLKRNLKAAEIVAQIHLARSEYLPAEQLRHVVFMGIGEPLHNLAEVHRALQILSHPDGLDLSTRRITVSTIGVVRGIDRLGELTKGQIALAISLHAATPETRARIVPHCRDSLGDIIEALKRYPLPKRRRFTIEYVLIKDINDSVSEARELVRLLSGLRVKVNLLPLNPHDKCDLLPADPDRVLSFQKVLIDKGLTATLRRRRGADIGAACGQLLATPH